MAVTNIYSIGGEILGEKVGGASRTDYLTDALGSVTGTLNQSAQIVNTYRYKPYGAQLAKTGAGADPSFGWVGTQGYRKTSRKFSDFYVRARHYSSQEGQWNTKDPIGFRGGLNLFLYANVDPLNIIDPSGLQTTQQVTPTANDCKDRASACEFFDKHGGWPTVVIVPGQKPEIIRGQIFCCLGKKYICTNPIGNDKSDGLDKWRAMVRMCIRAHEEQHIIQGCVCIQAKFFPDGTPVPQGLLTCGTTPTDPDWCYPTRECDAYIQEIECLQQALELCKKQPASERAKCEPYLTDQLHGACLSQLKFCYDRHSSTGPGDISFYCRKIVGLKEIM